MKVLAAEVTVEGEFGSEGEPAKNVTYHARVTANAPESAILALMTHTDRMAEIQNTLRIGTQVRPTGMEATST
jgi:hypothetical protein